MFVALTHRVLVRSLVPRTLHTGKNIFTKLVLIAITLGDEQVAIRIKTCWIIVAAMKQSERF